MSPPMIMEVRRSLHSCTVGKKEMILKNPASALPHDNIV